GDEGGAGATRTLPRADVNAAAKKYLRPNEAVIAIVGPVARIQKGATGATRRYVTAREKGPAARGGRAGGSTLPPTPASGGAGGGRWLSSTTPGPPAVISETAPPASPARPVRP